MEPTNRFTNLPQPLLRMDRDSRGRDGTFTVEALGPGYDVADLTRGGIAPQVTVTAEVDWPTYPDLWWSDLRMTTDTSPEAEHDRRRRRLARIAADILTDTGHLTSPSMTAGEQAAAAEAWLRERGYDQLWQDYDTAAAVARRIRSWFDDAFMIAACHPRPRLDLPGNRHLRPRRPPRLLGHRRRQPQVRHQEAGMTAAISIRPT